MQTYTHAGLGVEAHLITRATSLESTTQGQLRAKMFLSKLALIFFLEDLSKCPR
jgi:hypothetical protein